MDFLVRDDCCLSVVSSVVVVWVLFLLKVLFFFLGYYEILLFAFIKMLERFFNNLFKYRENVIFVDSEKKSFEEVSGEANS